MKKLLKNAAFRLILIATLLVVLPITVVRLFSSLPPGKKNILLITTGAMRSDHLSSYGYSLMSTPGIDQLAAKGVKFNNAYASSPSEVSSIASLLTGRFPEATTKITGDIIKVSPGAKDLSKYLSEEGYDLYSVSSDPGFLQKVGIDSSFISNTRPIPTINDITQYAKEKLKTLKKNKKPFLLWVNYPLPRFPYKTDINIASAKDKHPYDKEILLVDSNISDLLNSLKKMHLEKDTMIIFTSLTGESLTEHGELTHGIFLYDSTVKVPLIISLPGKTDPGSTLDTLVSTMDITPTVLDVVGLMPEENTFDGISLSSFTDKQPERNIFLESNIGNLNFSWSPQAAIVSERYKYIASPSAELYDLKLDPHELINIYALNTALADEMALKLNTHLAENSPKVFSKIGSGADPKDKISLVTPEDNTSTLSLAKMLSTYKTKLEKDPENKTFMYLLADLYYKNREALKAEEILKNLLKKYPESNRSWELLGLIYQYGGKTKKAMDCYKTAIDIYPDMPVSLNNIAWNYAQTNKDLDEALSYAERANQLAPENASFMDTLAEVYFKMGETKKAIDILKAALEKTSNPAKMSYLQNRIIEIVSSGSANYQ